MPLLSSPKGFLEDSLPRSTQSNRVAFLRYLKLLSMGGLAFIGMSCQRKQRKSSSMFELPTGIYYQVKRGDTLYHISKCCAVPIETVMRANRLYVTELEVGQVLFLPKVRYIPYQLTRPRRFPQSSPLPPRIESTPPSNPTDSKAKLQIVTRQQWGAAPSKPNSNPMGKVKRITLHHTSEYPGMNLLSDREVIRSIAQYHRETLGWADIGYHFIIGRDGKIYEGRSSHIQGAHTGGHNENNLGISMAGDYVSRLPSSTRTSLC